MKPEDTAKEIIKEYSRLEQERRQYDRPWQDIRELVRPNAQDFYRNASKGDTRTENIYDGTAVQANEEFASAIQSYMVSPTERWFALEIDGKDSQTLNQDETVISWLSKVSDAIYNEYSDDRTNHASAVNEALQDIGAFGNCVLNQEWNSDDQCVVFRAIPMASVSFCENQYGRVDKLFRCIERDRRQLEQQFGANNLPQKVREDKTDKKFELIHHVCTRDEREYGKMDGKNRPYSSHWVLKDPATLLKEDGYYSFPYHVARWSKVAGETYGRGPAIKCLPDIKMLNRMEFTIIKAASKAVDPPLIAANDGILLPIRTAPGSINFVEPGMENPIQALEHRGNIPIGLEMSEQRRAFIRTCFYADWVKLMPKKERQTAYEISELVEQQLRMMAPMLGKINTELLAPMIVRTYELLKSKLKLPEPPEILKGSTFTVVFQSSAARAQLGNKAMTMGRYIQEITPLVQFDPKVTNGVNFPKFARRLAQLRGVDPEVLRSDEEIEELNNQQDQMAQAQAAVAAAEPASKAVKNLADANAAGNIF